MSIPETIERWAARTRKPLEERIAALTQECDQLRAEVERLSAPVSDEQAEASFHAWNSVCSNSTRWNELEPGEQERWKAAMLAARRKP